MPARLVPGKWQVWLAIAVCAAVLAVDFTVYRPARARMQRALQSARSIGLSLDPSQRPIVPPAPVQEFMMANSIPEADATGAVQSGLLTASVLEEATRIASENGLTVVATEPGLAAQQGANIVVRSHIRARGTYTEFLSFLDALSRGPHLLTVDRFEITAGGGAELNLAVSITRHVLKRTKPGQARR
jgi:hypothetical protein